MRRIIYNSPALIDNNIKTYVPIFKNILVDKYVPSIKTVFIEVFYTVLFSHHLPIIFKGGGFFGGTKLINTNSLFEFLQSYVGKILFYFMIFYILHFVVLTHVKKIDIKKFL